METNVFEIAEGIYRISVAPTNRFEFNHFLIVDEKCMLIHTGGKAIFGTLLGLVEQLIEVKKLDYIAFSHFESDECGALNEWLKVTPLAVPLINAIGKSTMEDFSARKPEIVRDGQLIDLGRNKIQVLETPHVPHGWEACMFYETTRGILFSSDFGAQPGINSPITEKNVIIDILKFQIETGFMPEGEAIFKVADRLSKLKINYLATMHGSALKGDQVKLLFEKLNDLKISS